MNMGKILLGLGGAALLYEWYTGGLTSLFGGSSAAPSSSSKTVSVPASTTPIASSSPTISLPSASNLTAKAQQLGLNPASLTVFQWIYVANQMGYPVPNFNPSLNLGPTVPGSASAYLNLITVGGNLSGLGMIINLTSMYRGATPGSGFGTREFNPDIANTLNGLGEIVDDANNSAAYIDEGPFNEAAQFLGSQSGDPGVNDFILAAEGQGS